MLGYFNLQVLRGLSSNRSLLSCQATGLVDLWNTDDASGRQRWVMNPVEGQQPNVFTLAVYGGTNPGETYLSATVDGTGVTLDGSDDGSGRQWWAMVEVDAVASGVEIPSYYQLQPVSNPTTYLSCTADGTVVDLYGSDDGSGRQRWQTQGPGFDYSASSGS
jgi:hypothetical protein